MLTLLDKINTTYTLYELVVPHEYHDFIYHGATTEVKRIERPLPELRVMNLSHKEYVEFLISTSAEYVAQYVFDDEYAAHIAWYKAVKAHCEVALLELTS